MACLLRARFVVAPESGASSNHRRLVRGPPAALSRRWSTDRPPVRDNDGEDIQAVPLRRSASAFDVTAATRTTLGVRRRVSASSWRRSQQGHGMATSALLCECAHQRTTPWAALAIFIMAQGNDQNAARVEAESRDIDEASAASAPHPDFPLVRTSCAIIMAATSSSSPTRDARNPASRSAVGPTALAGHMRSQPFQLRERRLLRTHGIDFQVRRVLVRAEIIDDLRRNVADASHAPRRGGRGRRPPAPLEDTSSRISS